MSIFLVEKKNEPLSIKIKVLFSFINEPCLFLWEDTKTKSIKYIDKITLTKNLEYYSGINKNIDFFKDGITFKVVLLKNNSVIFNCDYKNLKFIHGSKILYISQNSYTGYSYAARNYVYQLITEGYDVKWDTCFTKSFYYQPQNDYEKIIFNAIDNPIKNFDSIIIHHTPEAWKSIYPYLYEQNISFDKVYGLTTWETTKLHEKWINYINDDDVDEVIVPSKFNVQSFKNSGVNKKINLWYHDIFPFIKTNVDSKNLLKKFYVYDNGLFLNDVNVIKNIIDNNTVYYNISQYINRKNLNQIVHSMCKKFTKNDSVCLFLKTNIERFDEKETDFLKYKFYNIIKNYTNYPNIIFCFDNLTNDEINIIHEFGDVYFTLNRGEGFGLCTYTAKKIGNRVICGKFGAEKEFLDDNDILLNYELGLSEELDDFSNYYVDDEQQCAFYDTDYVVSKLQYFPKTKKQLYNYS